MKKILIFNIFIICALVAGGAYAAASTPATPGVVGDKCEYNGTEMADGALEPKDCSEIGISNGRDCYLYCNDGTLENAVTMCSAGYYALDQRPRRSDLYKRCGSLKDACLTNYAYNSGARWNEYTQKCDCGGLDYEWSNTELRCVISADKRACDAASDRHWDSVDGRCKCIDADKEWNEDTHSCELKPGQAECDGFKTKGAGVEWNPTRNECQCIEDADGNEITNYNDYMVNAKGDACVKKPSTVRRESRLNHLPFVNDKVAEVQGIIDELNSISGQMGKSHWKTASGNFNTARLASDSIAGVVLGTVGGVITSNVVKKNQVRGGFEDINCTVGGQRVAGFSDEFNVGIQ